MTSPVMPHITTVSQKVALMMTRACSPGEPEVPEAAAIGAEPRPASLVNNPREIP